MADDEQTRFRAWVATGVEAGWATPTCGQHDPWAGAPPEFMEAMDDGDDDPCLPVLVLRLPEGV